jgi:hypothetical protein
MALNYVGSVTAYLALPLFALFGTSATAGRIVSALMTLVMLWAMGRLLRRHAGNAAALAFGVILAMNPSFVSATTLDSGCTSNWMLGLALVVLGADEFLRSPDRNHAFGLGFAAGFSVWCRANCAWFLFAATVTAILIYRRDIRRYLREARWIVTGGVVGAAPFLLFQIASRGAIFRFMESMGATSRDDRLVRRLGALATVLVSSSEGRKIWGGPGVPTWQLLAFSFLAIVSIVIALASRDRFARFLALNAIILAAIMVVSRLPVVDHHMVGLLPVVAATAAVVWSNGPRWRSALGPAILVVYVVIALMNLAASIRGVRATGGIDAWSDAGDIAAADPDSKTADVIDWGLYNNLYVLTNGSLQGRELFWGATTTHAGNSISWRAEIGRGGTYLLPATGHFPQARAGFLRALRESQQSYTSRRFLQRNGRLYAELYRVTPRSR